MRAGKRDRRSGYKPRSSPKALGHKAKGFLSACAYAGWKKALCCKFRCRLHQYHSPIRCLRSDCPTSWQPIGIDVSPDAGEVWVSNLQENSIAVIDNATERIVHTFPSWASVLPD